MWADFLPESGPLFFGAGTVGRRRADDHPQNSEGRHRNTCRSANRHTSITPAGRPTRTSPSSNAGRASRTSRPHCFPTVTTLRNALRTEHSPFRSRRLDPQTSNLVLLDIPPARTLKSALINPQSSGTVSEGQPQLEAGEVSSLGSKRKEDHRLRSGRHARRRS
jgi:hypothetical protein